MNLADMTTGEIEEVFGVPAYKAKQVYTWLRRGTTELSAMTDLSKAFREELSHHEIVWPTVYRKFSSKLDDTVKYLIRMADGQVVETVLMSYEHGKSICVSSQVGCRMGCRFCASTMDGLVRNLTPSEIEGQIRAVSKDAGVRISNVVMMGIGEPMDNYDNVVKALRAINHPEGLGIGYRHVTISTSGLLSGIDRLTEEGLPVTLALSLHATDDAARREIMPVANSTTIRELIGRMDRYAEVTGRRVTYEYALIGGVNDGKKNAEALGRLLSGRLCHVNLIDVNPVEGRSFTRGNHKYEFLRILENHGVAATLRRELGRDISASCGQLKKSEAEAATREE